MGTLGFPKAPITTGNFSTDKIVIDDWRSRIARAFPWARDVLHVLTGSVTDGAKTQSIILDINEGPPPLKIARQKRSMNVGSVWDGGSAGWPSVSAFGYLPHVTIPRRPMSSVNARKLTDDKALVPAVYAGNPRGYNR